MEMKNVKTEAGRRLIAAMGEYLAMTKEIAQAISDVCGNSPDAERAKESFIKVGDCAFASVVRYVEATEAVIASVMEA